MNACMIVRYAAEPAVRGSRWRASRRAQALAIAFAVGAHGAAFGQAQEPQPDAPGDATAAAPPATAAPPVPVVEPPPPLYESRMLRLSEILGGLYFLQTLCKDADAAGWRTQMASLLDAEQPSPGRRQKLVARFNYGFETYRAGYRVCTPAARRATTLYLGEGRRLVADLRARFAE